MDPLTLTETEARFRKLLESMLCKTTKHRSNCACQKLKNIYGGSIYKCGRPGCPSYTDGFHTRASRDQHMQRHSRPFKCQYSECHFAAFGFAKETDLESHSAKTHSQNLQAVSGATQGLTNASNEEELKSMLIDAVQENDFSMIQAEQDTVRESVLDLLVNAYRGRSSDAMIKHLVGELPARNTDTSERPDEELCREIIKASVERGHYDVVQSICRYDQGKLWNKSILRFVGTKRCADLIEIVLPSIDVLEWRSPDGDLGWRALFNEIIPLRPDAQEEILALACLDKLQSHLSSYKNLSKLLLLDLARRCCSIAIAELLLANGAEIDFGSGGLSPLTCAAQENSREAAKFMEFLVRKGARTSIRTRGKLLSELPGPKNIQKWIGITWTELVEIKLPSIQITHLSRRVPATHSKY